jgi:hypothetical protein
MDLLCLQVIWEDSSWLRNGSVQFGIMLWTLNVCETNDVIAAIKIITKVLRCW